MLDCGSFGTYLRSRQETEQNVCVAEMVRVPRHAFDKMILLGKNYLEHAKELGDKVPPKPVLFMKPPSSAVAAGAQHDTVQARLPKSRGVVHYETEVLLRLNDDLEIDAVSLGLDLTLRDLQADLKANGWPWEIGKVFKDSAIIGPWVDIKQFPNYMEEEFVLKLDGAKVQHAKGNDMSMKPEEALAYIKENFPLCTGDIIFTVHILCIFTVCGLCICVASAYVLVTCQ